MKTIKYQNDPTLPDYCPNPALAIEAAIVDLASKAKKAICDTAKANKDYTDVEIAKLADKIDAIENIEGLGDKLAELDRLLKEVDGENDGLLTTITKLRSDLDALTPEVGANTEAIKVVDGKVADLTKRTDTIQDNAEKAFIDVNERITLGDKETADLKTRVDTVVKEVPAIKDSVTNIEKKVLDLENSIGDLDAGFVTETELVEVICAERTAVVEALDRAKKVCADIFSTPCA